MAEITAQKISRAVLDVVQSNQVIQIYDLEWFFNIDPITFLGGGSGNVKPDWAQGCLPTWKDQGVNCCAYALNYLMAEYDITKNEQFKNRAVREAAKLAEELDWGDTTTILQLQEFVEAYPRYRVTAMWNLPHQAHTYIGAEYEEMPKAVEGKPESRPDRYTLYLILYCGHWGACKSPSKAWSNIGKVATFCNRCVKPVYYTQFHDCDTGENVRKEIPPSENECDKCGKVGKHKCITYQCKVCLGVCSEGNNGHRCLVVGEERSERADLYCTVPGGGSKGHQKLPSLWVYDFESRLEIRETTMSMIQEFPTSGEDHQYEEDIQDVVVWDFNTSIHKVNYAYCRNVFSGESMEFFGDMATENFLNHCLTYNYGHNIFIAHNSSGYDARLIFSHLRNRSELIDSTEAIMRGNKFMQLSIKQGVFNTIFRDSLLHLPQSLAALAKDFCSETQIEKGFFPHLFNSVENYTYTGAIPALKYFDLTFCKSAKDVRALLDYHASWTGREDWCFMDELKKYCKNDVDILVEIVRKYHDNAMELFSMTPWKYVTAASYVHKVKHMIRGCELSFRFLWRREDRCLSSLIARRITDGIWRSPRR